MKVHYLEIVSEDVDSVVKVYEKTYHKIFTDPEPLLGGAKTCQLDDGSLVGVRAPLRETESPIIRPYWLVDDINEAVSKVQALGAKIAMPPMEIPGKGQFAIYILGANEQGLWQL
ncbi:hydroxylase [Pseudoalteromonas luteoviolacea]|uniref:VOC family protein n=1 Tax=Pseudoalteromonas luteoviolacea TaxID=43657 RepID=UPI001B39E7BF|nr:hydroxylase [Pseudoalteromonas luteoviolacea]MBQ4879977.1 hydroxylase [Pseudoalteromonas luteoviolacea]MBQ4908994.1 hydroxylase [Pseudoalteromonas luteoviolacea]